MADTHPLVGRTVAGRFRLTRLLGEGGMATVFVAEQDGEPREIALKIMNEELTRERSFVRRFEREAKAASLVVHANSVRIFGWGVADGMSWLAMELLDGRDLYDVLEQGGPLDQSRVARVLAAVCDALEVAHGLGIVHRDLKPENIMIAADATAANGERVKVLDFGIAKLVAPNLVAQERMMQRRDGDPGSSLTQAGTLIGTPAYMSPEQCKLENVDARSDIYTCGVLMYQLITGSLPFEGEAPLHTAMLHIHEPLRPPSQLAPDIDPRLEAVIVRALEKEPKGRYQTAGELAQTLRSLAPALPHKPAVAPGTTRAVSSRPQRASSAGGNQHPSTLRGWGADAPAPASGLESQRTLVADGLVAPPPSVRLRKGSNDGLGRGRPPRPGDAEPESVPAPSSDPADRARTLVREPEEASAVLSGISPNALSVPTHAGLGVPPAPVRRSGPQGTEVIHLHPDGPSSRPLPAAGMPPRRQVKSTLKSADEFKGTAGLLGTEAISVRAMAGPSSSVEIRMADDAPASEQQNGGGDADSHLATLPMGIQRPMLGRGHTVPVPIAHGAAPTLELVDRPRVIEPYPLAPQRDAGGLAEMSGARVLLLGFLAGAVLMAIVGFVYFYLLR